MLLRSQRQVLLRAAPRDGTYLRLGTTCPKAVLLGSPVIGILKYTFVTSGVRTLAPQLCRVPSLSLVTIPWNGSSGPRGQAGKNGTVSGGW